MRVLILPPRGIVFAEDSPWMALATGLGRSGHEVQDLATSSRNAEAVISFNHQAQVKLIQAQSGISTGRTALIVMEPEVTAPEMYARQALVLYGHRYAASPMWAKSIGGESFLWPQELRQSRVQQEWESFAASLINGDKRSAVHGSRYGLRRSVIQAFDQSLTPLAVFGPGWGDPPIQRLRQAMKGVAKAMRGRVPPDLGEAFGDLRQRPSHWLGSVDKKTKAFASAPSSIVIENSSDYVSEKLVDAICAGVVPLYVGPPLDAFALPKEIAIRCPPDAQSILRTTSHLNRHRRAEVVEAGREWLNSSESLKHDIRTVLEDLGRRIGDRFNQSN